MPSRIETAVTEYFGALKTLDVDRYVNSFAPDAEAHDPVGTPPHRGHEALRQFLTSIKGAWQSVGLTTDNIFLCGNGIGLNGRSITFEGIDVLECNDEGKVTTVRAYWDPGPVMAALQS
jgi:steroid delta-isomerase